MSIWNMTNIVVRYSQTPTDHFDDNIDIGDRFKDQHYHNLIFI